MQTATSETEINSRYLSICVHHYTLRAPCPKGQGIDTIPKVRSSDALLAGCVSNLIPGSGAHCSISLLAIGKLP